MATLIAAPFAVFQTRGHIYTADASGNITATSTTDIQDLISAGCAPSVSGAGGGGGGATTPPATVSAAGTNQATATQLTSLVSVVGTVASGTGVMVANTLNQMMTIVNEGANVLNVYPLVGMAFVGSSQNAPFQLAPSNAVGLILSSTSAGHILFGSPSPFG